MILIIYFNKSLRVFFNIKIYMKCSKRCCPFATADLFFNGVVECGSIYHMNAHFVLRVITFLHLYSFLLCLII